MRKKVLSSNSDERGSNPIEELNGLNLKGEGVMIDKEKIMKYGQLEFDKFAQMFASKLEAGDFLRREYEKEGGDAYDVKKGGGEVIKKGKERRE